MEGVCANFHMVNRKVNGWKFCPWCGQSLQIKHHCEHCNRDFISEESYQVHLHEVDLYMSNPCPNAGGKRRHVIKHFKHRGTMRCTECLIEYPVKKVVEKKPKHSKEGPALA